MTAIRAMVTPFVGTLTVASKEIFDLGMRHGLLNRDLDYFDFIQRMPLKGMSGCIPSAVLEHIKLILKQRPTAMVQYEHTTAQGNHAKLP